MSYSCPEIKRSFGGDDFILYMFEEDLKMIKSWASPYPRGTGSSGGYLFGLWTNTLNPVVHIVCSDGISTKEYPFLINENPTECPFFSCIGCWSFEQLTEDRYQNIKSTLPQRFVYLEVAQIQQDPLSYHPLLFVKKGQEKKKGRIEPLEGENPFRYPNMQREIKGEGQVSTLCNKFEAKSQISSTSTYRYNPKKPISYASAAKQGNQGKWSEKSDQITTKSTPFGSHREASSSPQERFKDEECSKMSENSCIAQWYETQPVTLRIILDYVKSLADDKKTVDISRNKTTLNMTMVFTHHTYEWSIDFPADFPKGSVKLKNKKFRSDEVYSYSVKGSESIEIFKAELQSNLQRYCTSCIPRTDYSTRSYYSFRYY